MRVININRISRPANKLFFSPNCSEVKDKLKIMLRIKGSATINGTCSCQVITNIFPNETTIRT